MQAADIIADGDAFLEQGSVRSLTIMNLSGDSTLVWGPSLDETMREVIARKLAEGVVFHVLERRFINLLPEKRVRVTDIEQAMASRRLSMADEDFAAIVTQGGVQLVKTPDRAGGLTAGGSRVSRDPAEIASNQCVAVRQYQGG